ncbi:MAG: hypothetical protein SGJ27_12830 [Candidatus Melainabacteria bacterium]|nr:hypothetical protein [Candidatus Melainabacteria bacterium]
MMSLQQGGSAQESNKAVAPLSGTIQHSESLPPLPSKFQAGAFFGAYGLPNLKGERQQRSNLQFKIPEWLAGKWQRSHSVETQRTELPSGKNLKAAGLNTAKAFDVFGSYQDKTGQIWQVFSSDHATGEVDRGEFTDRHTVTKYNLEVVGRNAVMVEVRAFHLILNKKTQRIVQSYQDEEFNTYTLTADGKVKTDSSVKVFDGDGAAKLLTRSHADEVRVSRFGESGR